MSGVGKSTFGQRAISEMLKEETRNSELFRCVLTSANIITHDCNCEVREAKARLHFLLLRSTILRFFKCMNLE